jgi:pimeloyl-ACP methyl ester carboxylesterase
MSTPVLLLHALGTDPGVWTAQRETFARNHPVLVPNLYRLGDGTASLDTVAARLAGLLDERGLDRVLLAGCSLGGYLAMAFLRHHADRVHSLALLGTRAAPDDAATRAGRLAFAQRIADPELAPELTAATVPKLLGAGTRRQRPDLLARVAEMARSVSGADIAWAQQVIAVRPSSWDVLAAFTRPAVVLVGADDELVSVPDARATADALPHARLRVVPDAGHLLPLEAPQAVRAALESLLVPESQPAP